ncbi:MAG: VCBS repeat-containing protein [Pyrinomonadaceae bacterium]|nr:VCBS repeat-containing protein [Pyrinomonadaceae bacterium]
MLRKFPNRSGYSLIVLALTAMMTLSAAPALAQSCSTPSFTQPPVYPVGNDVRALATADFDGDGRPDIASANADAGSVTVLRKVARGVPADINSYAVGSFPISIAAGDFNGDGKPDIVTANNSSSNISLLLNDGTGTFLPSSAFAVGGGPRWLATGDLNRDGALDVAVATSSNVTILRGNGSGGFNTPINLQTGASHIAVADFNNDGNLDLAFSAGSIQIRLGNGTGNFPSISCGAVGNQGFAVGDLNGDGKLDLVAADVLPQQFHYMQGDGTGCFVSMPNIDVSKAGAPRYVTFGDLNNDGKLDIMGGPSVMLNDGAGGFNAVTPFGTGSSSDVAVVGDFDADGNLDLATAATGSVGILLGDGKGSFKFAVGPPGRGAYGVGRGDLNRDGNLDLVLMSAGNVVTMLGDGVGGFGPPTIVPVPSTSSYYSPVVADFNHDTKLDVATVDPSANGPGGKARLHVLLGDGAGGLAPAISTSINADEPRGLASEDFNADGNLDLLTVNWDGGNNLEGSISIALGDGAGHFDVKPILSVPTAVNVKSVGVADFNGDSKLDLAIPSDFGFSIMMGDGSGAFGPRTRLITANASSISVFDFNGDGKSDLLLVSSEQTSVVLGDGSGGFGLPSPLGVSRNAQDGTIADFNGDGKADIAVARQDPYNPGPPLGGVSVFFGDGVGGFGPASQFAADRIPARIVSGDFNRDGRPDLVIANETANNLSVLLNTCEGPVAPPVVEFGAPAYSVGESESRLTLTVTRAGNTSGLSFVSYVTSDTAGANNCNVKNGIASSRCDYISSMGTLNFAADETSRTISISIVNDAYAENSEAFTFTLSNPSGATLGAIATTAITINDNDATDGTNPVDASSFFVRQHYIDFLNREPDTSGLNFWVSEIDSCTPKPQCTELKRVNVSAAFFVSVEFQETGYLVYKFYKAAYGNIAGAPVPIGLNEFLPGTQQIGQGVAVGVGNWQTLLESNKVGFAQDFVSRSQFTAAYPTTRTPAEFVDSLFTNAGVTPSAADRDAAINEFGVAGNTNDIGARGRALRRVAENPTFTQQETNRALVLMQYFGYLRRNPNDAPEPGLNFGGYNFWLGKLNQFNGNYVAAEMVKAFITSGEYRQRFGQ